MIGLLIIVLPLFIWFQFFEMPRKVRLGEEKMQQDPKTHSYENVVQFESAYMGDASNLNNLLNELPLNEYKESIELDSKELELKVDYDVAATEIEEKARQGIIYNSTAVFALIENVEQMEIKFDDEVYSISRDRVERWFGTTLIDFKDPETFQEKVQQPLTEDISSWFLAYTESE